MRRTTRGRDPDAFELFYSKNYPRITAYVRRRSSVDPDTIASSVFTIAWQKYDQALHDGLPWLYRTAQLELRNHQRTETRRTARETRDARTASTGSTAERELATSVTEQVWVRDLLAQLSPTDQEVLMLLYWEDLDHKSAARVLGCSAGTFAVRAHRARTRFARLAQTHTASEAPDPLLATPLTHSEDVRP